MKDIPKLFQHACWDLETNNNLSKDSMEVFKDALCAAFGMVKAELDKKQDKPEITYGVKMSAVEAAKKLNLDPKGEAGKAKSQLQLIPAEFNKHVAGALALGAQKYGVANWRTSNVEVMTYIGAIRRHLDAYLEGEDTDAESGASHLGHIAACCAIVLDAAKHGTLHDNRPTK